MADEQDKGESTPNATDKPGATAGDPPKTDKTTFTADELQREADRRVSEAQKKWREQQDAVLADKTKDAESKLAELTTKAEEAERYANFVEAASSAGIRNVKAAYHVAKGGEYFDKKGGFEAERFRKENPEFYSPAPKANAGDGAGATTNGGGMNAAIRAAAGY